MSEAPRKEISFPKGEDDRPDAWQEGNGRLYEHLRQGAPDLPDTLEAMQPLYAAVIHGCRAGRQQEAMDEVYWRRIQRGDEHFSWKKLGSNGSELMALAGFFDRPWSQPSARLTTADQAFILNEAGIDLRALGRTTGAGGTVVGGDGRQGLRRLRVGRVAPPARPVSRPFRPHHVINLPTQGIGLRPRPWAPFSRPVGPDGLWRAPWSGQADDSDKLAAGETQSE